MLLRRITITRSVAIPLLAVAFLGGCGGDGARVDEPLDGAAGDGAALYALHCAQCHGADLRGTDKGPSHLSIFYEPGHHGDDSFRQAVTQGARQHHFAYGDMPPIEGISEAETDLIIAFVRAEQVRQGFES